MLNPIKKYYLFFALILTLIISLTLFYFFYHRPFQLEVNFLDIGQGDATLIKSPYGQNILVDGGPDEKIIRELSKKLAWYDHKIDLIILTHPHDDHLNGLNSVLKRYEIGEIFYTGIEYKSPYYSQFLKIVQEKEIVLKKITAPRQLNLGNDCNLNFIYPEAQDLAQPIENLNNSSIVFKLDCLDKKFLLTGDNEKEIELKLVQNKDLDLSADIFKAGHHGSDTSNTENFITRVNPSIIVIPVGKDNKFGHPSLRLLKRLERENIKYYRTDQDGGVDFIVDKKNFLEKTE